MLTKSAALAEQEYLYDLCQDRPLITCERFAGNGFYGNASVLKEYMGTFRTDPLKAIIPHGVALGPDPWKEEIQSPMKLVYCWQYGRKGIFIANGKTVVLGAAPVVYALDLLKQSKEWKPKRNGTLFFPAHSTDHVRAEYHVHDLCLYLKDIPKEYQPITICLYWKDIELRHIYQSYDFEVVSAGHMFDENFLYRLLHLMSCHKYAMSNEVGSHAYYSVLAGCEFFLIDGEVKYISDGQEPEGYIYSQKNSKKASDASWTFRKAMPLVRAYVDTTLSTDKKTTPELLSEALL